MAARREKGLCFNCDEQFVYGHRCKNIMKCMLMTEVDELEYYRKLEKSVGFDEMEGEEPMEEIPISVKW